MDESFYNILAFYNIQKNSGNFQNFLGQKIYIGAKLSLQPNISKQFYFEGFYFETSFISKQFYFEEFYFERAPEY